MALNGLFCADVPLRNYSLTLTFRKRLKLHLFRLSYPGLVLQINCFICVVLVVAACYLGYLKNYWFIDWLIDLCVVFKPCSETNKNLGYFISNMFFFKQFIVVQWAAEKSVQYLLYRLTRDAVSWLVSVAHWHSARWAWNGYHPGLGSIPRPGRINCFRMTGVHALRLISRTGKRVWRCPL